MRRSMNVIYLSMMSTMAVIAIGCDGQPSKSGNRDSAPIVTADVAVPRAIETPATPIQDDRRNVGTRETPIGKWTQATQKTLPAHIEWDRRELEKKFKIINFHYNDSDHQLEILVESYHDRHGMPDLEVRLFDADNVELTTIFFTDISAQPISGFIEKGERGRFFIRLPPMDVLNSTAKIVISCSNY
ncbi:MAG: hypothetical protein JNL67_08340 [Planctomycetaceae bacterium]|nr:hypothetical protein [Planctomycetaceae bacterium]